MALHTTLYNAIFKRTSTFAVVILGGGIFFERAYDQATVAIFENINKGVSLNLCQYVFYQLKTTTFHDYTTVKSLSVCYVK